MIFCRKNSDPYKILKTTWEGAKKIAKFDVGHHPDEQPGDLAVNVLVIFVVGLSSESSSPVLLVSTRAVHYEEKNRKPRFYKIIWFYGTENYKKS